MEYVIWEESYNYVVPWNPAEDVSTLIESKVSPVQSTLTIGSNTHHLTHTSNIL